MACNTAQGQYDLVRMMRGPLNAAITSQLHAGHKLAATRPEAVYSKPDCQPLKRWRQGNDVGGNQEAAGGQAASTQQSVQVQNNLQRCSTADSAWWRAMCTPGCSGSEPRRSTLLSALKPFRRTKLMLLEAAGGSRSSCWLWTARVQAGLHLLQCCLCRKAHGTSWTTPAMCSPEAMPSCKSLNRSRRMLSLQDRQERPGLAGTTLCRGAPGHAESLVSI